MESIEINGRGLHTGERTRVTLRRSLASFSMSIVAAGRRAPLDECIVRDAHRGVRLGSKKDPRFEVESVEHLFAALGAWSVRRGLEVVVDGAEMPLADGGAAEFAEAIRALAPPRDPPDLVVVKSGFVEIGESTYLFETGAEPRLDVEVEFAAEAIGKQRAAWNGTFEAFVTDVAWARTFGFRRDAEALFARGRARGVDPRTVMVLDDQGLVEPPGPPARPSEFARHKLLDLLGDLYCFGGPPRGSIVAKKPGHAATHRAIAVALDRNLMIREALPKSGEPGNLDACERVAPPGRSG